MGDRSADSGEGRRVRVTPGPRAAAATAAARAHGWTVVDAGADVTIRDLAGGSADEHPPTAAEIAIATRAGAAGGREAFEHGATQWVPPDFAPEELALALDFAERALFRSVPQAPVGRRAGEDVEGVAALRSWTARQQGDVAVVVVRLSRFEFVNAAFGRTAGDALMAAVATRVDAWADRLPAASSVQRTGAEFIVGVAAWSTALSADLAQLEAALAMPFPDAGIAVSLGVGIGVADAAGEGGTQNAIAAARRAIGPARAADPEPRLDRLAADLHRALDRGEIQLRFQPQAVVATDAIVGVEVLSRWRHPVLGALGADTLFAAAERAGLGPALSDHIHRRACEEAAAWPEALSRLRLSINITAADLARAHFADALLDRIAAAGLARGRVTVEIVETELVDDLGEAAALLARLRGAGLRTAIDDFGTGYSSLAYLKALPIDYLKIDRSLTRDIAGSERDRAVVRGVIAMARSLGVGTIAEGVETEAERALLAAEGCDLYQGFLCAEPLDTADLARLIAGPYL